jgi:hypothetical protein
MVILALGLLCTFLGLVFFVGCFIRVDSAAFIERAAGDAAKIAKLHSLQDAWDKLGKIRQFIASTSAYLIMGIGLLLLRYEPRFGQFWWVVPALLAANIVGLLWIRKHAQSVLDPESTGHAEVLLVIRRQLRICITFGVVFAILALGPNKSFKPNPLRGSA